MCFSKNYRTHMLTSKPGLTTFFHVSDDVQASVLHKNEKKKIKNEMVRSKVTMKNFGMEWS